MKLLVVSDSHRYNDILKKIIAYHQDVDIMIHCGDSSLDKEDPLLDNFYVVRGNHDKKEFPNIITLNVENQNIMITHGHLFHVYNGNDELIEYMKQNNISICFHGHTHVPSISKYKDMTIINPGSTMINRGSYGYGTYAIIELFPTLKITYYHHTTHQIIDEDILEEGKELLKEFKKLVKNN